MPPRIIRLNVGGYVVQTAASTLTSGSAYFARLLSSEFTDLDAESNEAFVDRDGRYFPYILGYLRSGAVELPAPPLTVDALLAEAEYFAIDALVEALRVASAPAEVHIGRPLKADGQGMYVWKDAEIPGFIEAVCFTESSDEQHEYERLGLTRPGQAEGGGRSPNFGRYAETGKMYGSLIYSRGPCARENLIALRNMPQPLPNIWRDSGDASTIIAFFMQRFISRGHFTVDGRSLLMTRGNLADADSQPGIHPSRTVATCGLLMGETELFLLEPTEGGAAAEAAIAPRFLEQLGLSASAATRNMNGLGGGFKRFVFEPF